jgi:hypothetical protein
MTHDDQDHNIHEGPESHECRKCNDLHLAQGISILDCSRMH